MRNDGSFWKDGERISRTSIYTYGTPTQNNNRGNNDSIICTETRRARRTTCCRRISSCASTATDWTAPLSLGLTVSFIATLRLFATNCYAHLGVLYSVNCTFTRVNYCICSIKYCVEFIDEHFFFIRNYKLNWQTIKTVECQQTYMNEG